LNAAKLATVLPRTLNAGTPKEMHCSASGTSVNAVMGGFWGLGFATIINDD